MVRDYQIVLGDQRMKLGVLDRKGARKKLSSWRNPARPGVSIGAGV